MSANLLTLADRIRAALEKDGSLNGAALAALLQPDEDRGQIDRALAFLHGRDEILLDVATSSVFLRRRVAAVILDALAGAPAPLDIAVLARSIAHPVAVCCDVLGWLEREGRVIIDASDRVARG